MATDTARSTNAEIRNTLESAVPPSSRLRLGTALAELGRRAGLTDDEIQAIQQMRNAILADPVRFG